MAVFTTQAFWNSLAIFQGPILDSDYRSSIEILYSSRSLHPEFNSIDLRIKPTRVIPTFSRTRMLAKFSMAHPAVIFSRFNELNPNRTKASRLLVAYP